jgi:hypothetical protein
MPVNCYVDKWLEAVDSPPLSSRRLWRQSVNPPACDQVAVCANAVCLWTSGDPKSCESPGAIIRRPAHAMIGLIGVWIGHRLVAGLIWWR